MRSSIKKHSYRGRGDRSAAQAFRSKTIRAALAASFRTPRRALTAGEFKSRDTAAGAYTAADWTGAICLLNGIPRGDDIEERTGRQITMRSLELTVEFHQAPPGSTPVPVLIRAMIVYDKQPNGTALTTAQVLNTVGGLNAAISPRNLEYRSRFQVIRDMRSTLSSAELDDFRDGPKYFKYYGSMNLPVTYNSGDAGTVADITTGSLYLIVISDANPAGALPSFTYTSRLRYTDN